MLQLVPQSLRKDLTLLYEVTKAHCKMQNENSYLGVLWYLLGPVLLFGIMLFVFSQRLGVGIEQYPLYLLMGIITWNFFATGTNRAMTSITSNAALVKALPIRLDVLVISAVLHALISHSIEIVLFFLLMLWYGVVPTMIVPFLAMLLLTFLFTLGVGMLLAALYVFIRDLSQIWSVLTRAWWFATPIFYAPAPTGPGHVISLFNPMYYCIHLSRETLVYQRMPEPSLLLGFIAFSFGFLILGYTVFYSLRSRFISLL